MNKSNVRKPWKLRDINWDRRAIDLARGMVRARNTKWSKIDTVLHEIIEKEVSVFDPIREHLQMRLGVMDSLNRNRNGFKRAPFAIYYGDFTAIDNLVEIEKMFRRIRDNISAYVQACIIIYEGKE